MSDPICNHRWEAPRVETPNSMPVTHVCALSVSEPTMTHNGEHRCSCGAVLSLFDE
jgi:hypothetical protein